MTIFGLMRHALLGHDAYLRRAVAHVHADCGIILFVHLDPPVWLCFCTATVASALQLTVYQIGGSFAFRGKTCEHVNARAALHDASARVGMFASRIPFSQLSKNGSFSTVEKRLVLHYTSRAPVGSPASALRFDHRLGAPQPFGPANCAGAEGVFRRHASFAARQSPRRADGRG